MIEEVSKLNFSCGNLNKIKNDTVEVVINDQNTVEDKKKHLKNKYEKILNGLNRLYETHLKNLENIEKINFFKQIINNSKAYQICHTKRRL